MSGVVKGISKAFKKVVHTVVKILPYVAMAAAVYFSAGIALSYLPATQAFAAALPGFAGAGGAGTGIFAKVATSIGAGGGFSSAAAAGTAATEAGLAMPGATATLAANNAAGIVAGTGGAVDAAANVVAPAAGKAGASLTEKLLLAQMGTNAIAAINAPSPDDEYAARAKFRGSYYGMDENGKTAPSPEFGIKPGLYPGGTGGVPAPPQAGAPAVPNIGTPNIQPIDPNASIEQATQTPTQRIESLFPKGRSIFPSQS